MTPTQKGKEEFRLGLEIEELADELQSEENIDVARLEQIGAHLQALGYEVLDLAAKVEEERTCTGNHPNADGCPVCDAKKERT